MTELNEKHLFFHSKVQRLLSYHIKHSCVRPKIWKHFSALFDKKRIHHINLRQKLDKMYCFCAIHLVVCKCQHLIEGILHFSPQIVGFLLKLKLL